MGNRPADVVRRLTDLGVTAVGANCSLGPAEPVPVLAEMAAVAEVPLVAKPNAGMPQLVGGSTICPVGPAAMVEGIRARVDAGARLVGGCCGTTPEHIAALREARL